MLLEFHKGSNAKVDTKNIYDVYPSALDVRKCQRWFSKFRSGNLDLSGSYRSGRPTILDNDVIKGASGSKSMSKFEELSNALNQTWSTIQEHLQQVGKTNRAGVWVPLIRLKKPELNDLRLTTYCFNGTIHNRFFIA
ncbi:histone-lysine N-methyltransferase SETMAR [Trichonephila clavipes]|nr:histone-lysine N-methyltransferase SETMAR [Trichonephila clavipes]